MLKFGQSVVDLDEILLGESREMTVDAVERILLSLFKMSVVAFRRNL